MRIIGKTIGINFRRYDTTGESSSVERCFGVIDAVMTDGLVVSMQGTRSGEVIKVPSDVEHVSLQGEFYFPESDDWVKLELFHEVQLRTSN